jgi:tetratricopeptide (TPR) repeat protein
MNILSARFPRLAALSLIVQVLPGLPTRGQVPRTGESAVVQGTVCDAQSLPLKDADVFLESADHVHKFLTRSDLQGRYVFKDVPPGSYTWHSRKTGYVEGQGGPFVVSAAESKIIDVHLSKGNSTRGVKDASSVGQFFDEPQFQIAGIADPSSYGGHGSDTTLHTKEALAKDTDSLKKETSNQPAGNSSTGEDAAEMHRRKGDVAEKEGQSLEAVREYQLAAQLRPSEANLFAWGAELLLHRAFEPAIEVFAKGRRMFPNSVRMAVGLSIATYDQGATEQGEQLLLQTCDINPADPTPYLFMGRLQEAEEIELPGWIEKLHRFSLLEPDNPVAHYYYAVALSQQNQKPEQTSTIEAELKRAIGLDPKMGQAYLQLGRLYAARKDDPSAIAALQKAIENLPLPDEAHYRLAEIYRQMGNADKAREETALYKQTSQQRTRQEQGQRYAIQRFVYTLGAHTSSTDTKPR